MKIIFIFSVLLLTVSSSLSRKLSFDSFDSFDSTPESIAMLNSMQHLLTGQPEFDPVYRAELYECMGSLHPDLLEAHEKAWTGLADYQTEAPWHDRWGRFCNGHRDCATYMENNKTVQNYRDIIIYEPCNYASNTAYYKVATNVCKHRSNFALSEVSK